MAGRAVDGRVAALAEGRLGLVVVAQLDELGVSRKVRAARVASGSWVVVHPGVLRLAGVPVDPRQALLAACLYTGGVASHRSAAWCWGLDGFDRSPALPEVSVMGELSRRAPDVRAHRTTKLHHEDTTVVDGIPVTTVARTLIDLGRVVPSEAVEGARDDARRRKLLQLDVEDDRIGALSTRGRRGPNVLRAIRDGDSGRVVPDSRLERRVLRALERHGIPAPVRQHPVRRPGGRRADADLAWPDRRLIVEVQSWKHHSSRRSWSRDMTRSNDLTSLGWRVMAVTRDDLRDGGAAFARTLRRALAASPPRTGGEDAP
jgi:hypothetical protein